jgi:hypothetical protein
LTLEPLEDRALLSATVWTVNSLGDSGTGSGNSGDLRFCITQADQTPGDNTINFAVTGTITLNSALPDLSNTTGIMDIEGPGAASLTVARSSNLGTPDFSIFTVDAKVEAKLVGLKITGGNAGSGNGGGVDNSGNLTLANSTIDNNSASGTASIYGGGGGIFNNGGTVTLTNSTITDNSSASWGGGIDNEAGGTVTVTSSTIDNNSSRLGGGGIVNGGFGATNPGGTVTVTNSTIANNSVTTTFADGGGGIDSEIAASLTIINSTIAANKSATGGGGINNFQGTVTVNNSTIDNNSAANGGGGIVNAGTETVDNLAIPFGMLEVTNSTISHNSASGSGGGIDNDANAAITNSTIAYNSSASGGGGIYNESIAGGGTLKVTNSTIDNNSASGTDPNYGGGGGIWTDGTVAVTNSTIAYNNAAKSGESGGLHVALFYYSGTTTLDNTIVALNTNGGAAADDIAGTVTTVSAYNLIGTGGSGGLVNGVNGNQVGVANPGLGKLADNGGPTQTIALLPGSPAIDKGTNALAVDPSTGQPLTTDQRGTGFPRIVNGTVDIGAYEFHSGLILAVTAQPPGSVTAGSSFGLTVTVEDSSGKVDRV